jgi:uncharacterized membrane protein SirB2
MSYEFYKIIHLFCIGLFLSCAGVLFWNSEKKKLFNILMGITSVLILVSGMGLIARIGISHGEGWPIWLKLKVGIWVILTVGGPVVVKRFNPFKKGFYWLILALYFAAIYIANFKPEL